jgi:hypothetical protein
MRGRRVGVLVLACAMVAACGSSGKTSSSSTLAARSSASALATSPAAAPAVFAGVRGRVLSKGELPGFASVGPRALGINAASWVVENRLPVAQRAAASARLGRLGFVAGVREDLIGPHGLAGLSTVEQFHSSAGARGELANVVRGLGGPGVARFAVPGVPGATGFAAPGTAFNTAFADGSYCYLIGAQALRAATPGGPTQAGLIVASQRLYRRVHR